MTFEVDADSAAVLPKHLSYPPLPQHATKVNLNGTLNGSVTSYRGTVAVTWDYLAKKVPSYLKRSVVQVTVQATGLSRATVIAIARSVSPD